jgi:YggT family protein
MALFATLVQLLASLFTLILFARLILDYVRMFRSSWTPQGPMLFLAEAVYVITDPPIKFVRKIIPPLRLGPVAVDLSFIVLLLAIQVLTRVISSL